MMKPKGRIMRSVVLAMCMLFGTYVAFGHHQLGLPHYLYSEDYPQIPTMVIDADAEGYLVTFSIYPGNPQPGDVVRVKVYIKYKSTGAVYNKPINISIGQLSYFGGEQVIMPEKSVLSEYNEYKISYEFAEAEKYLVNVTFEPRAGFFEKIPFPIVIGKSNFSLIPIFFGVLLLGVFIGVGILKRKKFGVREAPMTGNTHG